MADLRIFSYLPNPRLYKATIAARLTGVEIEIRGARPRELPDWLWDFDARPLADADRSNESFQRRARAGFSGTLYKTDAFLAANPFGTVPVAFSPDGTIGIFESNSMLRAVARIAKRGPALYGVDPYTASRIDGFLDTSLNFAHVSQRYLFALPDNLTDAIDDEMTKAVAVYLGAAETALANGSHLVGDDVTLADICFAAELTLFSLVRSEAQRIERQGYAMPFHDGLEADFPRAIAHFHRLLAHPAFAPDLKPYYDEMTLAKFRA